MNFDAFKAIASISTAGALWVAETVTPDIPGVPQWVTALGLPVAFLVAVIYALISVHRAHAASEKGRLEDKDKVIDSLKNDAILAAQSRERLTNAMENQSKSFDNLAEEIRRKLL